MKQELKRKGFTLVELLIVIVVIGILSAMMMLSSSEAVTSAKVSNIVSNLRNYKTAVLAYYADHMDAMSKNPSMEITGVMIAPYLNKTNVEINDTNKADYLLDGYWVANDKGDLYVACELAKVAGTKEVEKIRTKLADRAKSTGLRFSNSVNKTSIGTLSDEAGSNGFVVMWVR